MRFNFFRDFYFIALVYNVREIARQTSQNDLKLSKAAMKSCLFHFRIKNKSDIGVMVVVVGGVCAAIK